VESQWRGFKVNEEFWVLMSAIPPGVGLWVYGLDWAGPGIETGGGRL